MRVTLGPLPCEERSQVTEPLLEGRFAEPIGLARDLNELRPRPNISA